MLHSPFVKMVRKAFARLVYQDHLRAKSRHQALKVSYTHYHRPVLHTLSTCSAIDMNAVCFDVEQSFA